MSRLGDWFKKVFGKKKLEETAKFNPIIYNGERLNVSLNGANYFTKEELSKLEIATQLLVEVVNSLEFKIDVLNAPLVLTNGLKPSEVYNLFMSGKDSFNTEEDNDMDISITIYYKNNKTVGYTYPNTYKTWINRKFFRYFDYAEIVGNLVHEYCHNVGFTHPARGYGRYNVPYYYGDTAEKLCDDILDGRKLTPINN